MLAFPGGRIAFFNDGEYGPYQGSILGFDGDGRPGFERELWFGDRWGIYYRYFRWFDQSVLWTLSVSFVHPLLLFSFLPGLWFTRSYRFRLRTMLVAMTVVAIALCLFVRSTAWEEIKAAWENAFAPAGYAEEAVTSGNEIDYVGTTTRPGGE